MEALPDDLRREDAQRESCEAYINSMSGLGWRLVEKHYDDGGFTGANVHRPALNQLLRQFQDETDWRIHTTIRYS